MIMDRIALLAIIGGLNWGQHRPVPLRHSRLAFRRADGHGQSRGIHACWSGCALVRHPALPESARKTPVGINGAGRRGVPANFLV